MKLRAPQRLMHRLTAGVDHCCDEVCAQTCHKNQDDCAGALYDVDGEALSSQQSGSVLNQMPGVATMHGPGFASMHSS